VNRFMKTVFIFGNFSNVYNNTKVLGWDVDHQSCRRSLPNMKIFAQYACTSTLEGDAVVGTFRLTRPLWRNNLLLQYENSWLESGCYGQMFGELKFSWTREDGLQLVHHEKHDVCDETIRGKTVAWSQRVHSYLCQRLLFFQNDGHSIAIH
jgi:hypothetical protein